MKRPAEKETDWLLTADRSQMRRTPQLPCQRRPEFPTSCELKAFSEGKQSCLLSERRKRRLDGRKTNTLQLYSPTETFQFQIRGRSGDQECLSAGLRYSGLSSP